MIKNQRGVVAKYKLQRAIILLILLLECVCLFAQEKKIILGGNFFVDLAAPPPLSSFGGVSDPNYTPRLPDGEAAALLLAEARWIFAGIIWGFDYVYTPSDKARNISELFEISPRWLKQTPEQLLIIDSSINLDIKIVTVRLVDTVLYAYLECHLKGIEVSEQSAWPFGASYGQATASSPYFVLDKNNPMATVLSRRKAVLNASKEALRTILRDITHNKPREVRGSFALASSPSFFIKNGEWHTSVKLFAGSAEIDAYSVY